MTWAQVRGNITVDLKQLERKSMHWIVLPQGRDKWQAVVNMVMNTWVP
jgi:hypothetical protein